ncbi:uncharacterized protein LOC133204149 [Saccostrea echinata]|uniref:uncharacterized protein LOC133204149 n=1 Tax=Saccostrea echinata TaxID=191078 RepID=UPI002A831C5C|nr:uncharacterized protein LOC133204149 [Saccostrea echinata]
MTLDSLLIIISKGERTEQQPYFELFPFDHKMIYNRRVEASSDDSRQWYEVMLALAAKSACKQVLASAVHEWRDHIRDWRELTSAINKSEERRELPTIPQPTHQIEWLARVNFKHRPVRRDVPEQRRHKVSKKQDLNSSLYVY